MYQFIKTLTILLGVLIPPLAATVVVMHTDNINFTLAAIIASSAVLFVVGIMTSPRSYFIHGRDLHDDRKCNLILGSEQPNSCRQVVALFYYETLVTQARRPHPGNVITIWNDTDGQPSERHIIIESVQPF